MASLQADPMCAQFKKVLDENIPIVFEDAVSKIIPKESKTGQSFCEAFAKVVKETVAEPIAEGFSNAIDAYFKSMNLKCAIVMTTGSPAVQIANISPMPLGNPAAGSVPNTIGAMGLNADSLMNQFKTTLNDCLPVAFRTAFEQLLPKESKTGTDYADAIEKLIKDSMPEPIAEGFANAIDAYIKSAQMKGMIMATCICVILSWTATGMASVSPMPLGNPAAGSVPNTIGITGLNADGLAKQFKQTLEENFENTFEAMIQLIIPKESNTGNNYAKEFMKSTLNLCEPVAECFASTIDAYIKSAQIKCAMIMFNGTCSMMIGSLSPIAVGMPAAGIFNNLGLG